MNNILPRRLLKDILCCNNIKFPIANNHYITGKNIYNFSNLVCIEKTLNNITCGISNFCNLVCKGVIKR